MGGKLLRVTLFALFFAMLLPFKAPGAEARIAVVDMEKLFNDYYKTKIIDREFQEQSRIYRNYIARQAELLKTDEADYKKALDSALNAALAEPERLKREAEAEKLDKALRARRAQLEQYAAERSQVLQDSAAAERHKVLSEIRDEVKRRAVIEGYTLVIDASGFTLNDTPAVVYAAAAIDITEKVLTELNRGATPEAVQEAAPAAPAEKPVAAPAAPAAPAEKPVAAPAAPAAPAEKPAV